MAQQPPSPPEIARVWCIFWPWSARNRQSQAACLPPINPVHACNHKLNVAQVGWVFMCIFSIQPGLTQQAPLRSKWYQRLPFFLLVYCKCRKLALMAVALSWVSGHDETAEIFHFMIRRSIAVFGCSSVLMAAGGASPASAATSGVITATGSVPAVCSVNDGSVTMTTFNPDEIRGQNSISFSANGNSTFSLSSPQLSPPSGNSNDYQYSVAILDDALTTLLDSNGTDYVAVNGASGMAFRLIEASVKTAPDVNGIRPPLPAGNYQLTSTLTCINNN